MSVADPSETGRSRGLAEVGLSAALGGVIAGFVLQTIFISIFAAVTHHPKHPSTFGSDVIGLIGLWIGFVGAAIFVVRSVGDARSLRLRLAEDLGFRIRLWPDLPLGIAAGTASQFLLEPLLELLLEPFVPHLSSRLGGPAHQLVANVSGPGLVLLGVLVCVGSPLVEELFFRGLLLRTLEQRFSARHIHGSGTLAITITAVIFGLAHFEALQLIGLIGFGVVLGVLPRQTRRLGAGICAHMTFNAITFIALAWAH